MRMDQLVTSGRTPIGQLPHLPGAQGVHFPFPQETVSSWVSIKTLKMPLQSRGKQTSVAQSRLAWCRTNQAMEEQSRTVQAKVGLAPELLYSLAVFPVVLYHNQAVLQWIKFLLHCTQNWDFCWCWIGTKSQWLTQENNRAIVLMIKYGKILLKY